MSAADSEKIDPLRLGHFNLYVSDLEAATHFYFCVCGIRYIAAEPHIPMRFLSLGYSHHELGLIELHEGERIGRDGFIQGSALRGQKLGLNHLGWEMASESQVVGAYRLAARKRFKPLAADHTFAHSLYLNDPDQNRHEFFADTAIDWREFLKGDMASLTGSWRPEAATAAAVGHHLTAPDLMFMPEALIHPKRLSHAVLRTNRLESLAAFFVETVGLTEVFKSGDEKVIGLRGSSSPCPFDLILLEGRSPEQSALHSIAFLLPDFETAESSARRLERAGYPIRLIEGRYVRGFVLRDPDGLNVEFLGITAAVRPNELWSEGSLLALL